LSAKPKVADRVVVEALRTIGALFEPGDVIEIRALNVGRNPDFAGNTRAGYFNFESRDLIGAAVRSVDEQAEGVYVTLNRVNPNLLARSANRLQTKLRNTTSDADIIEWRWLYIDADAVRPAWISATDTEHELALQRIVQISEFLSKIGWPEPVRGDSGNGGHLLYRLPEMELKQAGDLVKRCLKALASRFSDDLVKVDETTSNPARICKLYGTMARKGDSTPDRPHRRSALLETPEIIRPVTLEALEAVASEVPVAASAPKQNRSVAGSFDIDQWLAQTGLDIIKGPVAYEGGRKWTLRVCPFNTQHEKPVVIQLPAGALAYKCLHKSCSENDWKALRRLCEPGYEDAARRPFGTATADGAETGIRSADLPLITDLSQIPSVFSFESQLDWCVDGMIARGSITLISAESGTGKTWLGYYLAGCIARGVPVLGRPVKACKVLYLDGENPAYVVKQRLFDLGISETPELIVWGGWAISPPVGPQSPLVVDFARRFKGVIIYDSLIEFHPGSEQSSTETRAFMRYFRMLANLGATVIILHHTGKAETSRQYRGSSDIKAAVDTAYLLTRDSPELGELGELTMTCFKARLAPPRHFGLEFRTREGFIARDAATLTRTATQVVTEILELNPNSNQTEIVRLGKESGFTKRQIENCLRTGAWSKSRGLRNAILYSVPTGKSEADYAIV
jgi:hypothetical protein